MMFRERVLLASFLVCLTPVLLVFGCAQDGAEKALASGGSDRTMQQVRNAHRLADEARSLADQEAALHALQRAFERYSFGPTEAGLLLRQDLADRSAKLCLALRRPQAAFDWTERGLGISRVPSLVRANLLLTKAEALGTLGNESAARGVLLQALTMNQALLKKELKDP